MRRSEPGSSESDVADSAREDVAESTDQRLDALRRGERGRVTGVGDTSAAIPPESEAGEIERRLLEMGFVEGAGVEVLHEAPLGGDPLAVRVSRATVALRRREASVVSVAPASPTRPRDES